MKEAAASALPSPQATATFSAAIDKAIPGSGTNHPSKSHVILVLFGLIPGSNNMAV